MAQRRRVTTDAQTPALANVRQQVVETRAFVEKYQDRILSLMNNDANRVRRFMQTFSQAIALEPKLGQCTRSSVIGGVLQIATLGLEPGVLGQAWLIPFRNKGTLEAQIIVGYRGFLELARRSGQVGPIEHATVYEKDLFDWQKGTDSFLHWRPADTEDRGERIAAWASATIKGYPKPQFDVMLASEILAIQQRAPSARANTSPWITDTDAMWAKTVIRRLAKFLPMSVEMQTAVSLDELGDASKSQNLRLHAHDLADVPIVGAEENRGGEATEKGSDDDADQNQPQQ